MVVLEEWLVTICFWPTDVWLNTLRPNTSLTYVKPPSFLYGMLHSVIIDQVIMRSRLYHDDVIKWKHFPCYWTFMRGIHRSPVSSPHKGQWRGALLFSLVCPWINSWVNNREAGDLRRHRVHYDVSIMKNARNMTHGLRDGKSYMHTTTDFKAEFIVTLH